MTVAGQILFGEQPRQYRPAVARALGGIHPAAVLEQLHYWLQRATKEHNDHKWIYYTYADLGAQIGLSPSQTERAMQKLRDIGVLVSIPNPKVAWDKTLWWRLDPEAMDLLAHAIERPDSCRAVPEIVAGEHEAGPSTAADHASNTNELHPMNYDSELQPTTATSAGTREAAEALEFFVDHRNAHSLGKPEWRRGDLAKTEWLDSISALVATYGPGEVKDRIAEAVIRAKSDPGLAKSLGSREADKAFASRWDQFKVSDTTRKSREKQRTHREMLDRRMEADHAAV
jgi:hypothetical protein